MKNYIFTIIALGACFLSFAQEKTTTFNETLAKSLNADEYGMKKYVFCLLKSGTNTTASAEETKKAFEGHMSNINRLANEGKLSVAGPFMKNDRSYRGIYIFNVESIEEAQKLVETDPAIQLKLLEAELTLWYASAALQQTNAVHQIIAKTKF